MGDIENHPIIVVGLGNPERKKKVVEKMMRDAADCVGKFLQSRIAQAMNVFNK